MKKPNKLTQEDIQQFATEDEKKILKEFNRRKFEVKKSLELGYGSHTQRPTPDRFKKFGPGTILTLDGEAPNGNVWFIDPEGNRGVVEAGEVRNLIRSGNVVELEENKIWRKY
jgi:hypothetical protein